MIVPLQLLCPGWWELNIGLKFWSSLLTLLKSPWWERAALDICIGAGHLWSCVSFSYEVHLASDSIEVSQPRFVSCSAKQSAERDSCVSYSIERPRISWRATKSRRDSCVSISEEKGHVSRFLAQTRGGFWERVYVSFSTSKGHVLFVYLTQGELDMHFILAQLRKAVREISIACPFRE